MNGEQFSKFVRNVLLPHLNPFNGVNPRSVVIMDNVAGAKVCFLPPYSPDLNPAEGVRSI